MKKILIVLIAFLLVTTIVSAAEEGDIYTGTVTFVHLDPLENQTTSTFSDIASGYYKLKIYNSTDKNINKDDEIIVFFTRECRSYIEGGSACPSAIYSVKEGDKIKINLVYANFSNIEFDIENVEEDNPIILMSKFYNSFSEGTMRLALETDSELEQYRNLSEEEFKQKYEEATKELIQKEENYLKEFLISKGIEESDFDKIYFSFYQNPEEIEFEEEKGFNYLVPIIIVLVVILAILIFIFTRKKPK